MFTEFFISLLYYDDCYKFYKKIVEEEVESRGSFEAYFMIFWKWLNMKIEGKVLLIGDG